MAREPLYPEPKPRPKTGRSRHKPRKKLPLALRFLKGLFVLAIWAALIGGGALAYFASDLPAIESLEGPALSPAVRVLAADGSLVATYGNQTGEFVPYDALPKALIQAVVATEDRRFFSHSGIDLVGILRAAFRNLEAGGIVEGGSTITQQLAKIAFLGPERTLKRKIQEGIIALLLERKFTKEEILTIYLNRVYLGAGTYGVDAASRRYFGKSVRDVSLAEAATLAGLLKAPSRYAPTRDPKLARARAKTVLENMVEAGYLTPEKAETAGATPAASAAEKAASAGARYFADWVLDQVPSFVGPEHGELTVITTLDPRLQRLAEDVLSEGLAKDGTAGGVSQGAMVALSPDGEVLAMVGGRDYRASQFNRATQALRQPGSAFKAIVYAAALEDGVEVDDTLLDAPVTVGDWAPENYDRKYYGEVSVEEAFARSLNTATVRLAREVGLAKIRNMARKLGITAELPDDLTISLGAGSVSLLELTQAYAAIADGGARVLAHSILEIRDKAGETIYRREGSGAGRAFGAATARAMQRLMGAVVAWGTGRAAQLPEGQGPAFGKTGTSQDFRDAWFIGFARGLVVGVWLGNDDGQPMNRITGGSLPARLWARVMSPALGCVPERFEAGCPWLAWRGPEAWDDAAGDTAVSGKALSGAAPQRSPAAIEVVPLQAPPERDDSGSRTSAPPAGKAATNKR